MVGTPHQRHAWLTFKQRFNDGGIDMALDGLEEFKSKISPETANQLKLAAGDGESRTAKQTALLQALMSCKVLALLSRVENNTQ